MVYFRYFGYCEELKVSRTKQIVPLLDLGIHTASGSRHDGGRMVTFKLPEGWTIRVFFHVCEV